MKLSKEDLELLISVLNGEEPDWDAYLEKCAEKMDKEIIEALLEQDEE